MVRKLLPGVNADDYSDEYDDDSVEVDEIDQEAMRRGKEEIARVLGERAIFLLTEKQIEDALWDAYYEPAVAIEFLNQTYLDETADDKLAAVAQVQSRLGEGYGESKVSAAQLRDALTYYSFDVEKVVAYLDRTYINPSPKAPKVQKKSIDVGKKTAVSTSKKAIGRKSGTSTSTPQKVDVATEGVAKLTIAGGTRPKSKNIDVLKEYEDAKKGKKSTSFVVVGHVDAGKSTLMGRLLLELKFVDKHTVDKYRREAEKIGKQSFALAWVMDQREEERDRGVTMDIATNHFETDKTRFTILDAPGHKDFIPNMIAGTSQADFAILVIDAGVGAFEKGLKGQTYEHVLLLRSLGVHRIIVAVNKMDTVDWSKDRFDEISQQVTGFLTGKGFLDKNVSFIPISGFNGDNLTSRSENKAASWYQGTTLLEKLDASEPVARPVQGPFRMAISELWKSPLGQVTASGRIDKGNIQIGDAILIQPSGEPAYIKSLMVDDDLRDWAVAGDNVCISLAGVETTNLRAGDIMCSAEKPLECGTAFTMKAMAFDYLMPMPIDLHRGRLHSAGQLFELDAVLDKATGDVVKKKPKVLPPGAVARVQVKLASKIPLERGQRVVIRSGGETVAAGLIE